MSRLEVWLWDITVVLLSAWASMLLLGALHHAIQGVAPAPYWACLALVSALRLGYAGWRRLTVGRRHG